MLYLLAAYTTPVTFAVRYDDFGRMFRNDVA
jgi:hypothetical protein